MDWGVDVQDAVELAVLCAVWGGDRLRTLTALNRPPIASVVEDDEEEDKEGAGEGLSGGGPMFLLFTALLPGTPPVNACGARKEEYEAVLSTLESLASASTEGGGVVEAEAAGTRALM